jgi:tellurite resistance protein
MEMRHAKCLLLAKVLVADGIMTENERVFLDRAMQRLGLDETMRKRVTHLEDWDAAEPIVAKLSEDEKREVVSWLVDAASADGKLSPLEMAAVKKISAALGLDG